MNVQKLTLPGPATRALQLPEVVARARRVAAERARPLRVQDHSLECAETSFLRFLVSYMPLARSA